MCSNSREPPARRLGGFPRPFPAPASTLMLHKALWLLLPSSSLCGCPQYSFKPNFNCRAWLEGYQELCHLPGVLSAPGGVHELQGRRETAHESPRATECPVDGIRAMVHSSFSSFGPTSPYIRSLSSVELTTGARGV